MRAIGTRRATLAVIACELIPVPLVDTVVQNEVRRTWIRHLLAKHGLELAAGDLAALADHPLLPAKRAALWPFQLLLHKLFPPLVLWEIWTLARDTWQLGNRLGGAV